MSLLPRIPLLAAGPTLVLVVAWASSSEAAPAGEPLLGLYVEPAFSLTLPSSMSAPVVDVYGTAHPTGAVGLEVPLVEKLSLLVELEAQGWQGQYDLGHDESIDLRFLNYWIQARLQRLLWRVAPIELWAEALVGLIVGREEGERFRAAGQGVALGAGLVLRWPLNQYLALTLNTVLEGGWVWYRIRSPQTRAQAGDYRLDWPRFVVSVGVHGYLAHRARQAGPGDRGPALREGSPESEGAAQP